MMPWQTLLHAPGAILADGAMGTMLQAAGLPAGESPLLWNAEQPERVAAVHRAYLEAGSQVLITNTFTGSRFRLARHGLADCTAELNRAGAAICRAAIDAAGGHALVAGDIGPSGELLAPLGALAFDEAVDGFAEQATALIAGGADVIWTMTLADLEEARAVIEGVRRVAAEIPIIATLTFDRRGRTMMGVTPEQAAEALLAWGAAAIGGNCGSGPEETIGVIQRMRAVAPAALLVAKANAGKPELVDGKTVFPATPAVLAQYAADVYAVGARIIGGCCGNTPAHVAAMGRAVRYS